ncbi:hypothetical protein LQG66_35785 [Bradyrhizobium ontarionense]|uniref:Uncharacterized protein n=1 Tax=Bradyrhizobium ontarionense TaxID=2898149 RepID=A0ABY3RCK8_9BRAD|nr:hypothetical protein [Bradyrhizobium sp. A19]UFZ04488.1 hypothetical protein LQG66_35785 [Bradyrhizobium sp. A19]
MVDEVFALSPISARAAQPNEADYEAIRDAFMETSRGRWFLGEYAKRNRNADTSMVLDAVARIEHALASQRQQQQELDRADSKALPEALAAIRAAVEDAALAAASAVDGLALEKNLAPARKGTRIIKEISWRWREIGADSRICDLIDSQLTSIEAACEQLASTDPKAALLTAFEIIKARLSEFDGGDATVPSATDEVVPSGETTAQTAHVVVPAEVADNPAAPADVVHPAELPEATATTIPLVAAVAAIEALDAQSAPGEMIVTAAVVEAAAAETYAATIAQPTSPIAPTDIAAAPVTEVLIEVETQVVAVANLDEVAAAEAQDRAILDLVAAEMGAPETTEDEGFSRARTLGFDIEEPTSVDDDIVASFGDPAPSEPELALATAEAPAAKAALEPAAPSVAPIAAPIAPVPTPIETSFAGGALAAVAVALAAERTPPPPPPVDAAPRRQAQAAATAVSSTTAQAMPRPAYEPSLGSTLLSNGLLQRPQVPANDPLSPIRRMSQPEKIAFFS